jgi:hypothetical protein
VQNFGPTVIPPSAAISIPAADARKDNGIA